MVERLAVVVAYHHPESTQVLRRKGDSERGYVMFQVATDKVFPPESGCSVVIGQIASREPSPKPQLAPSFAGSCLVERQGTKVVIRDLSGETLGDFPDEIWRGAAEQEVSCGRLAVRQDLE